MKQLNSAGGAIMEAQMVDNQFRDLQDIWHEFKIKKNKSIFLFL